jgi:hypothetical protein
VDSRNHAVVAMGVTAGLVAALLRLPLLDTLVGLAVAVLILKSGAELALETVQAMRGKKVDFSRHELGFVEEYRRFQERQLADWLLCVVEEEGPLHRVTLLARCRETLDARDVPILRELGWSREGGELEKRIARALEMLVERGLIDIDGEMLDVAGKGRAELSEEVRGVEEVESYARAMKPRTRPIHVPLRETTNVQNVNPLVDRLFVQWRVARAVQGLQSQLKHLVGSQTGSATAG